MHNIEYLCIGFVTTGKYEWSECIVCFSDGDQLDFKVLKASINYLIADVL